MRSDEEVEAMEMMAAAVAQLPASLQQIAARMDSPVLHTACVAGELELVRALIDAGLAPDMYPCTEDEEDEPPLTWIARYRDTTCDSAVIVAKLLIERDVDVDEGLPLLAAAENEDLTMMRLLLAAGADPEAAIEEAEPREVHLIRQMMSEAAT